MATIITPSGGQIVTNEGTWSDAIDTTLDDLAINQMIYPEIRPILEYAQKRMLMTLITSGGTGQFGIKNIPSKVGDLVQKAGKSIGSKAYQFAVQGRIQRSIEINSQIGASGADGTFTLSLKDRLYEGMNCLFNGQGFQARVMSNPTGGPGNWIINFKSASGTVFSWATHVAGQGPVKTLFGGNTSYGEGSLKGYSDDNFPDFFINHTTIERMTDIITGDAASQVLRYTYTSANGESTGKGWMYQKCSRNDSVFMMQNEYNHWFGESTMKGAGGTLLPVSRLIDTTTGKQIIAGDGVIPQIDGGNRSYGSGVNGKATASDFVDMVKKLRKKSNDYMPSDFICVTDIEGFYNFQYSIAPALAAMQNVTLFQNVNSDGKESQTGLNFYRINVAGTWITLIEHPMFSDTERFTAGTSTLPITDCLYIFLNVADTNVEVLDKGGNGFSRGNVRAWYEGLTGKAGSAGKEVSEEDAMKYARLRESICMVYNTQTCGIISR